jgi:uncharacterized protein (TIGR02118 family)
MVSKVICVVHDTAPRAAQLDAIPARALSLHVPDPVEAAEHPDDVRAVVMAWSARLPTSGEVQTWFADARVDAYLVDERVRIDDHRDWPPGEESPGIGRISFVRALPGLGRAEMARHWGEVHWPIARVHHPALWRYVQNVVVEPITPDAPEVDGIAELRFRSVADLRERFYDSEEGKRIVADDVVTFLDRGAGWRLLARETWIRSP